MFKKIAIATPLAILALNSSMAFAADEMRSTINIKATVPTTIFHAQPSNSNPDFGKDETMGYNLVSGELGSLRAVYDVKHSDPNGSIHAFVEGGQSAASLYSGSNAIPLTVTFNGVELSEVAKEVVNAVDSTPGTTADMIVSAAKPAGGHPAGNYNGTFAVVFEPVITP